MVEQVEGQESQMREHVEHLEQEVSSTPRKMSKESSQNSVQS